MFKKLFIFLSFFISSTSAFGANPPNYKSLSDVPPIAAENEFIIAKGSRDTRYFIQTKNVAMGLVQGIDLEQPAFYEDGFFPNTKIATLTQFAESDQDTAYISVRRFRMPPEGMKELEEALLTGNFSSPFTNAYRIYHKPGDYMLQEISSETYASSKEFSRWGMIPRIAGFAVGSAIGGAAAGMMMLATNQHLVGKLSFYEAFVGSAITGLTNFSPIIMAFTPITSRSTSLPATTMSAWNNFKTGVFATTTTNASCISMAAVVGMLR